MFFLAVVRQYSSSLLLIALLSLLSAAGGVLVLMFIHSILLPSSQEGGLSNQWIGLFLLLVVVVSLISIFSQVALHRLGHRFVLHIRQKLSAQILETDLEQLQKIGQGRVLAMLTTDVRNLTVGFIHLPELLHSLFLSIAVLGYLAWLSLAMFFSTLAAIVVVGSLGILLVNKLNNYVVRLREDEDKMHQDYQSMISGKRELTLNRSRAKAFFDDDLTHHAQSYKDNITKADSLVDVSNGLSNGLVLSLIGFSMYMSLGWNWATPDVAAIYALAILFLRTPLMAAVAALPVLLTASVSYRKIQNLNLPEIASADLNAEPSVFADFSLLEFKNVEFRYDENSFGIGPIDLSIKRGELIYVIGGNGSGKSTFANLLTGLYQAQKGHLCVDGKPITQEQILDYRKLFSAVFSDFHVFRQLLNKQGDIACEKDIDKWLERFQMQHKVSANDGVLSAVDFSQGQKKRLALILAALEDRECLLLDEWAADQDPQFRHLFYTEILPYFNQQGKTIIAITHDDHYFDSADRILKMDEGKLYELSQSDRQAINRVVQSLEDVSTEHSAKDNQEI